jgi:AcrR family transcriptional regulator
MAELVQPRDGRSTRWDPHRRERRVRIIEAAIEAIEQHGPDVLTAQIAELAGVPRTHVYRHFDGKPALDLAVSTYVAKQIGSNVRAAFATAGSTIDLIGSAIDRHLAWVDEHPNLYRFLARNAYAIKTPHGGRPADAKAAFAAELTEITARYMEALDQPTEPAERMIVGVVGLVDATASWWIERREPDRATVATDLKDQVWLIMEQAARRFGVTLDPNASLPRLELPATPPNPTAAG